MAVTVRLTNRLALQIPAALESQAEALVEGAARSTAARAAEKVLDPPKTGRIYKSKRKPSPHQASAPGEAPANWTGALVLSITARKAGKLAWEVRAGTPYARRLEFGSASGKVAPRPFMLPALAEAGEEFERGMRLMLRRLGER